MPSWLSRRRQALFVPCTTCCSTVCAASSAAGGPGSSWRQPPAAAGQGSPARASCPRQWPARRFWRQLVAHVHGGHVAAVVEARDVHIAGGGAAGGRQGVRRRAACPRVTRLPPRCSRRCRWHQGPTILFCAHEHGGHRWRGRRLLGHARCWCVTQCGWFPSAG